MAQDSPCYLQYKTSAPVVAGLDHQVANLRCLLREAHVTGRLAVLPPIHLCPKHNFGVRRDWKWEAYFDFGESRLIDATGQERPLPIADEWPDADDRTLSLRPGERMPSGARHYRLVVRHVELTTFKKEIPADDWPTITIRLRASASVTDLARHVVQHIALLDGGRFAAVHVRRGDRLKLHREYPGRLTEPAHIRKYLTELGVAEGSVLFIASDERDPNFWRPLAEHYRLIRYVDFPRLEALAAKGGDLPDNYLLYQVEREVMRSAWLRVGTLPKHDELYMHGSLVSEENWSRSPVVHNTWTGRVASRWRHRRDCVMAVCRSIYRSWCPCNPQSEKE